MRRRLNLPGSGRAIFGVLAIVLLVEGPILAWRSIELRTVRPVVALITANAASIPPLSAAGSLTHALRLDPKRDHRYAGLLGRRRSPRTATSSMRRSQARAHRDLPQTEWIRFGNPAPVTVTADAAAHKLRTNGTGDLIYCRP